MEFNKTIYTLRNDTACLNFFTKKKDRFLISLCLCESPYSSFPTQMAYPSDKLAMEQAFFFFLFLRLLWFSFQYH